MPNPFSPYNDPAFVAWKAEVEALQVSEISVRRARQTEADGLSMRWLQMTCESSSIRSVEYDLARIREQFVLLAEIDGHTVGFCCALTGQTTTDPVFIQLVTVTPSLHGRGVGSALVGKVAQWQPQRDIAMAVLDTNIAAQRLNERLARSMNGKLQRVPRIRFRPKDLGIHSDEKHRYWLISRS